MIQVIQVGQAGKTRYLLEMYRMRALIFKERMGWDVNVDMQGLETDDFDIDVAIYLLSVDDQKKVNGSWRIIPTSHMTMIEKIWPDFLKDVEMKKSPLCWEMSRFGILSDQSQSVKESINSFNNTTAELFCALTELCIHCGIEEIYTLYNKKIAKLLRLLDCHPVQVSEARPVNGEETYVGRFIPDSVMLSKLKEATAVSGSLVDFTDLPYAITQYRETQKEKLYAVA